MLNVWPPVAEDYNALTAKTHAALPAFGGQRFGPTTIAPPRASPSYSPPTSASYLGAGAHAASSVSASSSVPSPDGTLWTSGYATDSLYSTAGPSSPRQRAVGMASSMTSGLGSSLGQLGSNAASVSLSASE